MISLCQYTGSESQLEKTQTKNAFPIEHSRSCYFSPDFMGGTSLVEFFCSNIVFCVDENCSPLFGYFWGVDCWSNTSLRIRQFDDCRHIFRHLEQWKSRNKLVVGVKKGDCKNLLNLVLCGVVNPLYVKIIQVHLPLSQLVT